MRRFLFHRARGVRFRANKSETFSASHHSWLLRYGIAVLAVGVVLLVKLLLDSLITEHTPFLLLAGAVVVAAWFGGLGSGLLATALGTLVADYFFLPPQGSFTGLDLAALPLALFAVQGVVISSLTEGLRVARSRAEASALQAQSHQESLRQSEERFRLLIDRVEDYAIFMLDPQGHVASWNEGAERIKGYSAEEVVGEHFSRFHTEEDIERGHPEEGLRIAMVEGRYEEEGIRIRKDGSEFWASMLITALRDEEGNLRGFSKVVRDITERRETEQALKESEQRFRALVQNSSDIITVIDAEGTIRYVSPAVERIMGYPPEELVGKSVFYYVRSDDLQGAQDIFTELWSRPGIHPSFEFRMPHKDGSWRHAEFLINNLLDDPSVKGVVVNQRDITERKEAEKKLRESEELYRSVVEQAAENIFLVDIETKRIIQANTALHRSLGYSTEELRQLTLYDIVAHDRESVDRNVRRVVEEVHHIIGERRYRRKDGSLVDVEVSASVVSYEGGKTLCVVAHDVTEHKQVEKQLHELVSRMMTAQEKERRRVAYDIHDGFTQMAAAAYRRLQTFVEHSPLEDGQDRQELEDAVALVRRTVGEARRIIADLRPTTLDDFGLATAIRMQVEDLRSEGLDTSYEESLGEARLPDKLEVALFRVAQEALVNVRKHAQTDRMRVALGRHDGFVRLEVRDWGRGFEPAEVVEGGGPGERVGLSSMQERIVLLGGSLHIRSELGAGTSVVADVPLPTAGKEVFGGE